MSLRVALIGTGWVADHHIRAINGLSDARLVAIAGRNAARTDELSKRAECRGYAFSDVTRMLQTEALDAVFICLPPHVHGEIETQCAEHVPAVFIEKPITADLDEARRISEVFKKAGTLVSVGFMCRYRQSVIRARAALAEASSPPILANGSWVGDVPGPLWWRTQSQSGGQFVEQCTHMVDLARYLVDEIDEVSAYTTRGYVTEHPDYTVDDAAVVNVRFKGGAIGNFTTGCFVKPDHSSALGIGLAVQTRDVQVVLKNWDVDLEILRKSGEVERMPSPESDIFAVENAAFCQAIQSKDASPILSSYDDAIETLKVGLAATRSAVEKRPVAVSSI